MTRRILAAWVPALAMALTSACDPSVPAVARPSAVRTPREDAGAPAVAPSRARIRRHALAASPGAHVPFAPSPRAASAFEAHGTALDVSVEPTRTRWTPAGATGAIVLGSTRIGAGRATTPTTRSVAAEARRALADGIEESFAAFEGGADWTWRFDRAPTDGEDLVLTVPVIDGDVVGLDAEGVVLTRGAASLRIGHATFVDADGRRTSVPFSHADGALSLRVPASVIAAATYPAILDPRVTVLSPLTTTGSGTYAAYGDQSFPSADEMSGDNGFVAFLDESGPVRRIVARRFGAGPATVGSLIEVDSDVSAVGPAVSCTASQCLVAYVKNGTIVGRRYTALGAPQAAAQTIEANAPSVVSLAAADDGSGFALAWSQIEGTSRVVYGRGVASTGTPLGAAAARLGSAAGGAAVSATFTGTTVVVAWDELVTGGARILGARMSATSVALDTSHTVLADDAASSERYPDVVTTSDGTVVVVYAVAASIYSRTIDATSGLVASSATSMNSGWGIGNVTDLDVAPEGTGLTIVQSSADYAYVSAHTTPIMPASASSVYDLEAASSRGIAAAAIGTTRLAVVGALNRAGPQAVRTTGYDVVLSSGLANALVSTGGPSAYGGRVGSTGSQFGVTYATATTLHGERVMFSRFDGTGTPVGAALTLSTGTNTPTAAEYLDLGKTASIGGIHYATFCRIVNAPLCGLNVVSIGTLSTDIPGVLLAAGTADTRLGTSLVGGTSTGMLYNPYYSETRTVSATGLGTGVYTSAISSRSADLGGPVGIAWSSTSLLALSSTGTQALVAAVEDATRPPSIARGASNRALVQRRADGAALTFSLVDSAGGTTFQSIAVGTTAIGHAAVSWDGMNYNVVYVRGTELRLVRVTAAGAVLDATPGLLASDAVSSSTVSIASAGPGVSLVSYDRFDAAVGVRAMTVGLVLVDWTDTSAGAALGTACASGFECGSGYCVDGVCCESTCGLGAANDCMACSVAASGQADGLCTPATSTVTCRASAGACDVAETCSGTSTTCPADTFAAAGTSCGTPSTMPCRADPVCTGTSATCPNGVLRASTTVCRPADGPCDAEERCTGLSDTCPNDVPAPSTTVCRAAATACDAAERCTGSSFVCPSDAPASASAQVVCRPQASACDARVVCDGTSFDCPADQAAAAGTLCRRWGGVCDVEETCDGTSLGCPADVVMPAGQPCRSSSGACDPPETCDGTLRECPPDVLTAQGTVCRAAAGLCDVTETCTGSNASCPVDRFAAAGSICHASRGVCDVAELCSGLGASCPEDRTLVDGSACGDGYLCNGDETCQAGVCTSGEALVCAADAVCLEATGTCAQESGRSLGCAVTAPGAAERRPMNLLGLAAVALLVARRRRVRTGRLQSAAALALVGMLVPLGGCACPVGAASCGDVCVDPAFDEQHCGACGHVCTSGRCVEGRCVGEVISGTPCESDAMCDDQDPCTGVERCIEGRCRDGVDLVCDDGLSCTTDTCSRNVGACTAFPTTAACGVMP